MVKRLVGAVFRAAIVGILLTFAAMLMPDLRPASLDAFGLSVFALCALVLMEYGFSQPALLEFRFAPPYNRWRFLSLMAIAFGTVTLFSDPISPSPFNIIVNRIAEIAAGVFEFRGSPSFVMDRFLRDEVSLSSAELIVSIASFGYLVSFASALIFLLRLAFSEWPARPNQIFHFWSNLPTFHAVQPENATQRLFQFGILSVGMAFVFPYVIPHFLNSFINLLPSGTFVGDFTLFWIVCLTTWLPLVCLMRGFALIKVSRMILNDRRG